MLKRSSVLKHESSLNWNSPKTKMATYNINVLCDNKAVNTAEFDIQSTVCELINHVDQTGDQACRCDSHLSESHTAWLPQIYYGQFTYHRKKSVVDSMVNLSFYLWYNMPTSDCGTDNLRDAIENIRKQKSSSHNLRNNDHIRCWCFDNNFMFMC